MGMIAGSDARNPVLVGSPGAANVVPKHAVSAVPAGLDCRPLQLQIAASHARRAPRHWSSCCRGRPTPPSPTKTNGAGSSNRWEHDFFLRPLKAPRPTDAAAESGGPRGRARDRWRFRRCGGLQTWYSSPARVCASCMYTSWLLMVASPCLLHGRFSCHPDIPGTPAWRLRKARRISVRVSRPTTWCASTTGSAPILCRSR
jgi:hypothetical protein